MVADASQRPDFTDKVFFVSNLCKTFISLCLYIRAYCTYINLAISSSCTPLFCAYLQDVFTRVVHSEFSEPSSSTPGEQFEVRQTSSSEDYSPDPLKSLPLSPARQSLIDDIIALYSCKPTIERVKRYTSDCVYDDQFVYTNDRYKMAGQWFALPKLFKDSTNERYQIVKNDKDLIQFKN